MVKKLYLDGCSLTYGQGLDRKQSLGNLFSTRGGYKVTDLSRPGKSNMLISTDIYENFQEHDVFVIGFTFSNRFGIKYYDNNLDFFAGYHNGGLPLVETHGTQTQELNDSYNNVYKYFYTVFGEPYCDLLSDMLVDTLVQFLLSHNKTVIAFSWEKRNTTHTIYYPYIGPAQRLDDGHLNSNGMITLYNKLACEICDE